MKQPDETESAGAEWIDGVPPPKCRRVLFRTDDHVCLLVYDDSIQGTPFWYVPGPGDNTWALASYTLRDLQVMADEYKVSYRVVTA